MKYNLNVALKNTRNNNLYKDGCTNTHVYRRCCSPTPDYMLMLNSASNTLHHVLVYNIFIYTYFIF